MPTVLLVIVILLLLGALPTWPYSQAWGYYPSGGLGLLLIILIIVALVGKRSASQLFDGADASASCLSALKPHGVLCALRTAVENILKLEHSGRRRNAIRKAVCRSPYS